VTDRSDTHTVHGTCVVIGEAGVLIRGAPGAGKSDLALRLIDDGARLVSDDQVRLCVEGGRVKASSPDAIAGMIELNGVGLARLEADHILAEAEVVLLVDLVASKQAERLPGPRSETVLGVQIPVLAIAPFEASAPAKLRLAAGGGPGSIMAPS
jgi:serine kinase of HPr protein (carbohydrate metabolism regulator)